MPFVSKDTDRNHDLPLYDRSCAGLLGKNVVNDKNLWNKYYDD